MGDNVTNELLILCECGNSSTGSYGIYADIVNGEIICKYCGLVSSTFRWWNGEIHDR
jgi:hypothetical protein